MAEQTQLIASGLCRSSANEPLSAFRYCRWNAPSDGTVGVMHGRAECNLGPMGPNTQLHQRRRGAGRGQAWTGTCGFVYCKYWLDTFLLNRTKYTASSLLTLVLQPRTL